MPRLNAWLVRLALLATSLACAGWKWEGARFLS
jgi:hypothetical protein